MKKKSIILKSDSGIITANLQIPYEYITRQNDNKRIVIFHITSVIELLKSKINAKTKRFHDNPILYKEINNVYYDENGNVVKKDEIEASIVKKSNNIEFNNAIEKMIDEIITKAIFDK